MSDTSSGVKVAWKCPLANLSCFFIERKLVEDGKLNVMFFQPVTFLTFRVAYFFLQNMTKAELSN